MKKTYGLYAVMTNPVVGYEECARAAVNCGTYRRQMASTHLILA